MDASEKLKKVYKRQNAHIVEHYDRQTVTMPKGTKDRIKAHGESVNGFINRLIAAELERLEASVDPQQIKPKAAAVDPAQIEPEKVTQGTAAPEKVPSLEELQELLNAKREERAAVPEEIKRPETDEDEEPRAILAPAEPQSVTDAPGLSVRELAERAKTTVRDEEAKREAARQKSEAENAVAEMLKNRS